jgi:hypothetical protein
VAAKFFFWRGVVLGLSVLSCAKVPERPASTSPVAIRTISYTGYGATAYTTATTTAYLNAMTDLGANAMSILVTCYAASASSNTVDCGTSSTPTTSSITSAIQAAKAAGFHVNLRPYVNLQSGQWRGHWSPSDMDAAFASLQTMYVTYAQLAQTLQVDSMFLGAEFVGLTVASNTARWQSLIAAVRAVYSGKLSYGAVPGWVNSTGVPEYKQVGFWSSLDWVGIDTYDGLPAKDGYLRPTYKQLLDMENARRDVYAAFAATTGKPWVICEAGFNGARGLMANPAEWRLPPPSDPVTQARAYGALLQAYTGATNLEGIFLWSFVPNDGQNDPMGDTAFMLKGRPVWDVIRSWF